MRVPLAVGVAFATFVAGCLGPAADDLQAHDAPLPDLDVAAAVVAHTATGIVPVPDDLADLLARFSPTGHHRGEPTVGVTSDGSIYTVGADGATIVSRDHGRTWDVADDPVTRPKPDVDPFMWVDKDTDRVYNSRLHIVCTWLSWTDDGGASWDLNPLAGCGTPGHDHQKLTTGAPPEGVTTDGYPNVLYYQYNSFRGDGTIVTVSLDGGRTFGREAVALPSNPCHGGIAAPVAVAPDGTAYVPKHTCDGVAIAVTRDAGASWDLAAELTSEGGADWSLDPMADVDDAGNVHVVWNGADGRAYLSSSRDQGATWTPAVAVTPPGVTTAVFPDITAAAGGRVAVSYLGTTANASTWEDGDPSYAPDDTVWNLYLAWVDDAFADTPVVVSHRLTEDEDPVQRGCIWLHGGTEPCRNMRDFIDMVHHDGRVVIVYADGCDACTSAAQSRGAETTVVLVDVGPSLTGGRVTPLPT